MGYNNYLSRNTHKDTKITILKSLAVHEDSITGLAGRLDELEEIIRSKKNDKNCRFILSTIHASKGLEYDRVYLIDVADGIFPELLPDSPDDRAFEEERRIFYVGMTRAKKELDIWIPERRIAIEFNGNYWHCNPIKYNESYFHKELNMTAKQKWEYDELKINECQKMGIDLIVVWEYNWVHDKEQVKVFLQKRINGV